VSTIRVGSAPDSWGVWFPDDPKQTLYTRFLDEVAASGYEWIELGTYGYLPTDPKRLFEELAARDLKLSAGTVFERLHQDNSWDAVWTQIEDVARLEDRNLTAEQWKKKTEGMNELGVNVINTKFSGRPERAEESERAFLRSIEELVRSSNAKASTCASTRIPTTSSKTGWRRWAASAASTRPPSAWSTWPATPATWGAP
jgi:sugar phosphate isomerase/epimerase